MGKKGEETKSLIKQKAYDLFSQKGFKEVTMKDICQATGLSRGGLYRHYESTEQIFSEIMDSFLDVQNSDFMREINNNTPASVILETILAKYKKEMLDTEGSLSMAIYEFFSKKNISENGNILSKQYQASFDSWNTLIKYGIKTGEFRNIDTQSFFDLLVFSYQGVRMYSQLMVIGEDIPERIVSQLKLILLAKNERSSNDE